MRYLSVCSGIEAASVAWSPLGWQAAGYSEIEPFPRSVLEHRFGAVPVDWDHRYAPQLNTLPLFGDFTKIEPHHVGPIDLLVGGTPCQSFSVAGKRLGLDDPRGNLTLEFLALARRLRPRWLCWENVPGVLSDDGGRTMGTFLRIVGQLGYRGGYRVLDAQYVRVDGFGRAVPQRRRRVFFVGHLGDDARALSVLFERESLRGHPAPSRETGQRVASPIAASASSRGGYRNDADTADNLIASDVAPTVRAGGNETGGNRPYGTDVDTADSLIAIADRTGDAGTVSSKWAKGTGGPAGDECQNLVAHAFAIQERAVSENPAAGPQGKGWQEDVAYTLEARHHVQSVAHTLRGDGFDASEDGTGRGTPLVPVSFNSREDLCHSETVFGSLGSSSPQAQAVAFAIQERAVSENLEAGPQGKGYQADVAYTMEARNKVQSVASYAVRRLTPRECERLQGFPDDWTLIPVRGKLAADGPRYKAIGNSMAVNVMRWIGTRIAWADRLANEDQP